MPPPAKRPLLLSRGLSSHAPEATRGTKRLKKNALLEMAENDYLDLLIRCLNGELSDQVHDRHVRVQKAFTEKCEMPSVFSLATCGEMLDQADREFRAYLEPQGLSSRQLLQMDEALLFGYLNWMNPNGSPDTMCGRASLENVRALMEDALENNVPGDFIETGVWKGGMTVLMRGVLKAYKISDRKVYVADSFQGLPETDPAQHLKDAIFRHLMAPLCYLEIPQEYTELTFLRYDLLDEQVRFVKGWFKESLPEAGIEKLALARLDGDLYESTHDALSFLYPRVSSGGHIIIDDYGVPCGCRLAVDEFRAAHDITAPLIPINDSAVFWRKT